MPKSRLSENKGLPARWQFNHGAYYYRVPPGFENAWDGKKRFMLGRNLADAYKVYAERVGAKDKANTIGELLDRYVLEVVPRKAAKTQTENFRAIRKLTSVFGKVGLTAIRPQDIYRFVDMRAAKTAGHREVEVLSHAFTKAVEWGYIDRHPFKQEVRLKGSKPRTRYVEDWEVVECLALAPMRKRGSVLAIQAYIRLKLLTGMSQGDLLRLSPSQNFRDDGIHIQRHKTAESSGKRTIYEWSPELRAAVEMAKQARPIHISPWLFCNRRGQSYVNEKIGEARGWRSMWQRFIARVLKESKVSERFTEHDLRAKAGSDAASLERARAMLSHADARTTQAIYRRKPERVPTGQA